MEKTKILANVPSLSAEQLLDEIKQGNVTFEEIDNTGELSPVKRKKIKELEAEAEKKDDEAWECAFYGNEMMLRDYINSFPQGKHVEEAKKKITSLEQARIAAQAEKQEVLENIMNNTNSYFPDEINEFLKNGTLTESDLKSCGIPGDVIKSINNMRSPQLNLGISPESIPEGYTEVYFWGIPGSGKTCALAAILGMAEKLGYLTIAMGPGYDYMTRLKNIFVDKCAVLPSPSPVDTTQYLPFTLKKDNERYTRSISLIELSGEVFQCFYFKNAGLNMPSQFHVDTFNLLQRFLNSSNRKIHFFFIDYGDENKMDTAGYRQSDYLSAASIFFKSNQVFKKNTDAIYVVLTKSDLMPCSENERVAKAKEYLNNNSFKSFTNALKDSCKKHSINAGRLTFELFSLGKVYFNQICDFDGTTAENIINILLDRVPTTKDSILDFFNR